MPLVKRSVSPSALCRQSLPKNVRNELECVTNNTLSGVIAQLSSLSLHAEDLFGELFIEASSFYTRASKLQSRIDSLSVKVTQLDSTIEEVSLHDINMRKAFRSSGLTDQQVVSRESLPPPLQTTYNRANKPPPLQELNRFRDDGRDALKIYTDPDYFFNLWREAMQKEMRDAKEKRREQRKKERRTNPTIRRQHKVKQAVAHKRLEAQRRQHGEEFIGVGVAQDAAKAQKPADHSTPSSAHYQGPLEPNHVPPPPVNEIPSAPYQTSGPPPPPPVNVTGQNSVPSPLPPVIDSPYYAPPSPVKIPNGDIPDFPPPGIPSPPDITNVPPPPPPPPPVMNSSVPPPPPVAPSGIPPPPAPPVAAATAADNFSSANQGGLAQQLAGVSLKPKEEVARPAPVADSRSDLLSAIRVGINLKKVEQREKTAAAETTSGGNDVASILARRIAVEFSDSESDSFSSDDADWDDE